MSNPATQGTFTGRHMLAIMLGFFAVVIGVNVTMALFAGSSWTGFVVRNSYVASQEFNGKVAAARAQQALGWRAELTIDGGLATLRMADREGRALTVERVTIILRSPSSDADDRTVELAADGDAMSALLDVRDGLWVVEIDVEVQDHQPWRDTRRIQISGGTVR